MYLKVAFKTTPKPKTPTTPFVTVLSQPCRFLCVSLMVGKGKGEEVGFGSAKFPKLFNRKPITFSPSPPSFSSTRRDSHFLGGCSAVRDLPPGGSCPGLGINRKLETWWRWVPGGGQSVRSAHKAPGAVQPSTEETSLSVDWTGLYRQTRGGWGKGPCSCFQVAAEDRRRLCQVRLGPEISPISYIIYLCSIPFLLQGTFPHNSSLHLQDTHVRWATGLSLPSFYGAEGLSRSHGGERHTSPIHLCPCCSVTQHCQGLASLLLGDLLGLENVGAAQGHVGMSGGGHISHGMLDMKIPPPAPHLVETDGPFPQALV